MFTVEKIRITNAKEFAEKIFAKLPEMEPEMDSCGECWNEKEFDIDIEDEGLTAIGKLHGFAEGRKSQDLTRDYPAMWEITHKSYDIRDLKFFTQDGEETDVSNLFEVTEAINALLGGQV